MTAQRVSSLKYLTADPSARDGSFANALDVADMEEANRTEDVFRRRPRNSARRACVYRGPYESDTPTHRDVT